MVREIKLYTDGGARGNPGPAAIGAVAFAGGKEVFRIKSKIGKATNNVAEYSALIAGLNKISESYKNASVRCNLDSELLAKQLNGEYKVKNQKLKILFKEIVELKAQLNDVSFYHITRDKNKIADSLVNKALDNK